MSASPNYQGFLAIDNRWAVAILVKHLVFFTMIGVSAFITWGLLPRLQRAAMRQAHGLEATEAEKLQRQQTALLRLNLALGALVLALTAVARVS
jgi:O-antigen ligase